MNARDTALDLISFLDASPSPYHAASEARGRLTAAGVTEANNVFNGNAATFSGYQNLSRTSTVTVSEFITMLRRLK